MPVLPDTLMKVGSAILLAVACGPAAATAGDIVITHAKGETVLKATPRKVAVYDLATLDILNALGVNAVAGVPKGTEGKGNFPPYISKYGDARYQNVGTLFEPDLAALKALGPDLIVVGGRSSRKYADVNAIAPTIDMSSAEKDLAAVTIANTRKLGSAFGVSDRAEKRVVAFETLLSSLHAEAAGAGTGLLLFAAGDGMAVHAPGDRFGHVYDFAGIRPAVPAAEPTPPGPRPAAGSPEAEAARKQRQDTLAAGLASDPTWIFVIDRNAATGNGASGNGETIAARLGANADVTATTAWKAGRVIYLDPKTWYLVGAGIDALSQSARETLAALRAGK
ncbi:ABC-type enterochelin transport system, periplasmic component [Novosphingobium sp. AP12]|nr:ABC-type enterochelin transport system, periplasmic component [Novosphingobium sp. AP12]